MECLLEHARTVPYEHMKAHTQDSNSNTMPKNEPMDKAITTDVSVAQNSLLFLEKGTS